MFDTREKAELDAINRNPYGAYVATVRMHSGYAGVCLNSEAECQRWINMNREWLQLGSERIEPIVDPITAGEIACGVQ